MSVDVESGIVPRGGGCIGGGASAIVSVAEVSSTVSIDVSRRNGSPATTSQATRTSATTAAGITHQ